MVKSILNLVGFLIHRVALATQLVGGHASERSVQAVDAPVDDPLVVVVGLIHHT